MLLQKRPRPPPPAEGRCCVAARLVKHVIRCWCSRVMRRLWKVGRREKLVAWVLRHRCAKGFVSECLGVRAPRFERWSHSVEWEVLPSRRCSRHFCAFATMGSYPHRMSHRILRLVRRTDKSGIEIEKDTFPGFSPRPKPNSNLLQWTIL